MTVQLQTCPRFLQFTTHTLARVPFVVARGLAQGADSSGMAPRSATLNAMRIIAGEHRGRTLLPPQGDTTRPVTDWVKQSLFDILAPQIDGALVYDCFAGTGSMGLECLSRGANQVTFFEADRSALARLHQNIAALKVADRARVVPGDLFRWFSLANTRPDSTAASGADLVFLDPPYRFL